MVVDMINKYKKLLYTQMDSDDADDETINKLLIELESCNYMLGFCEDFAKFSNCIKFKSKNDKAKFTLNTIQAAVNSMPYKEDHEYKFKKACRKTLTWLFFTLNRN